MDHTEQPDDNLDHSLLADLVHDVLKGTPNEVDNRPGYRIHGTGRMERYSYRNWSQGELLGVLEARGAGTEARTLRTASADRR